MNEHIVYEQNTDEGYNIRFIETQNYIIVGSHIDIVS